MFLQHRARGSLLRGTIAAPFAHAAQGTAEHTRSATTSRGLPRAAPTEAAVARLPAAVLILGGGGGAAAQAQALRDVDGPDALEDALAQVALLLRLALLLSLLPQLQLGIQVLHNHAHNR